MIQVTIEKDSSGQVHSFEMSGHAEFAGKGKDLVCAGASAVSFGAVNAIMSLTSITPDIQQGHDGGFLKVVFPNNLSPKKNEQVQLLVQAMIVSLQTIEQDYAQHIKITFKK
jgi:uncharacterized protein YsxB (DUF464 family)